MKTQSKLIAYFSIATMYLANGLPFPAAIVAQDVFNGPPPQEAWANALLEGNELVIGGQFPDIPDDMARDLSRNAKEEVDLLFDVSVVYKGYAPHEVVTVRLNPDMLRYPGEEIARYSKRQQLRWENYARLEGVNQRISDLSQDLRIGLVSIEEFQASEAVLVEEQQRLISETVSMALRGIFVTHGASFYDLGGAIAPNEPYLLGLNRSRDDPDVLVLQETPVNPNVFWGRMREVVSSALDRQGGR